MHIKTMEGLVGASTNMNLLNTPMRVFKEARRRGDRATMERAMGYVGEFADKTEEYKTKAARGMEEDAKEAREREQAEREDAIRKRKEAREKREERIDENRDTDTNQDTSETGREGKDSMNPEQVDSDRIKIRSGKEPAIYTKTGEAVPAEQSVSISLSV